MNNRKTLSVALNVFEKFQPKLPESYRETPYVLLGNIAPSLQRMVCKQVRKPKFVVADTMDLWIGMARADLLELLKEVDMLILNDSEAKQLTEEDNLIRAGQEDRRAGAALRRGEEGRARLPALRPRRRVFQHGRVSAGDRSTIRPARAIALRAAFIGHLARTDDISFANLKEAIIQGTLVASFCCEEFSLRRLRKAGRGRNRRAAQGFRHLHCSR